jgi:hypothetical protein
MADKRIKTLTLFSILESIDGIGVVCIFMEILYYDIDSDNSSGDP